jgi:hypothetical protein
LEVRFRDGAVKMLAANYDITWVKSRFPPQPSCKKMLQNPIDLEPRELSSIDRYLPIILYNTGGVI